MSKIHFSALLFLFAANNPVFANTAEHPLLSFAASSFNEQEDFVTGLIVSSLIIAVYALYWLKQKA